MLDIYLLNETFTNGSNHSLLTFVSLASIFSGIFVIISKNPIVSVILLLGLFFIILLSVADTGLKNEIKQETKPDIKDKEGGSTLNLVHSDHLNSHGLVTANSQFLWDKNDPLGLKLRGLFFPKKMKWYGNKFGVVVPHSGRGWDSQSRLLITDVSTAKVFTMISNGDSIQSNGHTALITFSENGLSRIHVEENI